MKPAGDGSGLLFPAPEPPDPEETPRADAPLADRMRPRSLDEILGQEDVLGPGGGKGASAGAAASPEKR